MRPLENDTRNCLRLLFILISLCSYSIALSQPVAGFTANPTSGCVPLVVQFTDNSTGNPTSWNWDLGNGTVSSQKNPVTTYLNPGIYTIKLTATSNTGSNSITRTQYITVYNKPVVKFTVADSSNCVPFITNFTDGSTTQPGSITGWLWDFDDGSTSTLQNPAHLYNQPGNYNITLKVTNSGGCTNSLSKLAYIKAADSIRPQFNFTVPTRCKPPETINFTNNTLGPGTLTYQWNFGDGGTSTATAPSHNYLSSGLFSVTLIVKNNLGCRDTLVYKDTVLIKNVQSAINCADTVCVNNRITISNATTPSPLSSKWVFSDGSTAFGAVTAKTFTSAGNYNVKLVSNFNTCSDSVTKNIAVVPAPVIAFSASDSASCKAPFTVNFTDASTGVVSWLWDFGDGVTASVKNPTHTYTSEGEFAVKLTCSNAAGCTISLTQFRFIRILKPIVSFDNPDGGGCIPYTFKPYPTATSTDGIAGYFWDFGNGTTSTNQYPTTIYPDSGTYTVKLIITTNDGCIDSTVMTDAIRTGNRPVVNFGISTAVVCPGTNVQFTDSSAPADHWQWNFSDGTSSTIQNPLHQFSDSGKYSVKLIAWNNGCKDSLSKYRLLTTLPGLARFRPVYNCANKKEVYFKDSSILPQNWFWDFGDGTTSTLQNPTHQFANYQTYNVSLTSTNDSCTNTRTIPVTLLNEVPDFIAAKMNFCKGDSTIFYLQNFNKNNIAGYRWEFGDGNIDSVLTDTVRHIYTAAGLYTVKLTATDIYGCSETTVKANFIHVFGPLAGFNINAVGGCRNKVINFTDTSNTQNNDHNIAQWVWDFGDGNSQAYTAPLPVPVPHIYTSAGSFYPSLKITDSAGCKDSISYSMPINIAQPVANFFSPNFNSCINDVVILRNPSSGKQLTYRWDFGDGSESTDSLPAKQYTANGDFSIKLIVTDAYGCQDSMTKINYIKVRNVVASFKVSDSVGICTPFQVNFTNTSTDALSQVWDFGDGGLSSTGNPVYYYSTPGTYYAKLTAKRSNTCYRSDSIKITVTAPTAALNYVPLNGCAPLTVSFHLTTNDSALFTWDFNDGISYMSTDSNAVHTYLLPGNFIPAVILKDTSGCVVSVVGKDTIKLLSSNVNFGAIDTSICKGQLAYFSDSSVAGSTIINYQWDFGDGTVSAQQNPAHLYNNTGIYTVKLFIRTAYGCNDSIVKTNFITVAAQPRISITGNNPFYCGASVISFQGNLLTADTSAINWQWSFGNGNNAVVQNPVPQQYNDTGLYNIQLIATNSGGCADTANSRIMIHPLPNTLAGNDTAICVGNTAQLQASGADSYTWTPASFLSCTNCSNPVSTIRSSGTYYVTGKNIDGCEKVDTIYIDVKEPFRITGLKMADSACAGKSIQLNAAGAENYLWSPPDGLSNTLISNPVANPAADITYKVVGYDSSNCFRDSASISITVNRSPSVNAGSDIILNSGRSITLMPQYSSDITSWLWSPPTGLSCTNCANPVALPANGTNYKILVTNASGCTAEDEIFVQVKCDENSVYIPTAFTPGSTQYNQVFYPLNPAGTGTVKISVFKIYNRYGQLVFTNGNFYSNDKSKGWDGRYNGLEAAVGAYLYTIEFICSNNKTVTFEGNFLLIR